MAMELSTISMPAEEAWQKAHEYLALPDNELTPEDRITLTGYLALAEGKPVIDIRQTLRAGGLDEDGCPRLAYGRADWQWCNLATRDTQRWNPTLKVHERRITGTAQVIFQQGQWPHHAAETFRFQWPLSSEHGLRTTNGSRRSQVPPIPPQHRPKQWRLRQFWVLWEVEEWEESPAPPGDPALIRPLGHGLGLVEATWDLSDLERAVLGMRT